MLFEPSVSVLTTVRYVRTVLRVILTENIYCLPTQQSLIVKQTTLTEYNTALVYCNSIGCLYTYATCFDLY